MIDEILNRFGVKYEELNAGEKQTLYTWYEALQNATVTVESIRQYISQMRDAVVLELSVTGLSEKQDTLLKARLRNYTLLEAFLSTPDKAKQKMEAAIAGIANGVVG